MAAPDSVTGPINLGNPHQITIRELAERTIALVGSESSLVTGPLPTDDPTRRCPDIGRARALLDWQPAVALDDGLGRTITYFRELL